jgi:hypothetical protein
MHIEMWVLYMSFSLKASLRSGRYVLCALFLCFRSKCSFCVLYFRFCTPASNSWKYNILVYVKYISEWFRWYNNYYFIKQISNQYLPWKPTQANCAPSYRIPNHSRLQYSLDWNQGVCSDTSSTEKQCLRPLCHLGALCMTPDVLSQTEIRWTIRILATRKWRIDFCIVRL